VPDGVVGLYRLETPVSLAPDGHEGE